VKSLNWLSYVKIMIYQIKNQEFQFLLKSQTIWLNSGDSQLEEWWQPYFDRAFSSFVSFSHCVPDLWIFDFATNGLNRLLHFLVHNFIKFWVICL
jgi:hypothetical protein